MKTSPSSLAPILRSDTQGRILAAIMANPETEYSLTDLAARVGTSQPTVLREIDRAEQAGIVRTRRIGKSRLVRAEPTHRLYQPLAQIVLTTYGPPAVIAKALATVPGVEKAYLFGSWAARYLGTPGRWPNDIDVLVIGSPDRGRLYEAAGRAEQQLGVPVQMTVRSPSQWEDRRDVDSGDTFIVEVKSRPLVEIDVSVQGD
jgi:DNA-binding transcriptional ArsR family regulator